MKRICNRGLRRGCVEKNGEIHLSVTEGKRYLKPRDITSH